MTADGQQPFARYEPATRGAPPPADLLVRPAAPADIVPCVRLVLEAGGGEPDRWSRSLSRDLAAAKRLLVVATVAGEVVGYGRAARFVVPAGSPANCAPSGWYLLGLRVAPASRRRGIALALTTARLEWIWQHASRAWYVANAGNAASLSLHAALGLREVTRDVAFPGVSFAGGVGVLCRADRPSAARRGAD